MRDKLRLAVLDLETDPFLAGRVPSPFAAGFYDGRRFVSFYGSDCCARLIEFLSSQKERFIIYAHNGGRFDFFYLLEHLRAPLKIINGRIVSAHLDKHVLRDSFAILPVPLASYEKTNIDYAKFEADRRDTHREEIIAYLRDDCVSLFDLVSQFRERFGSRLTIAGTAIRELTKLHTIERQAKAHDARFRPFYFGGRVECFESGELRDDFKIADVNSMYPHAMANFDHPCGAEYNHTTMLNLDSPRLAFATVQATSSGALPLRTKDGLTFPHGRGVFHATAHELRAGEDLGLLKIEHVLEARYARRMVRFDGFVQHWSAEKVNAERDGDKAGRLFAKLVMNSSYGKTAQNPEDFAEWMLRKPTEKLPAPPWELYADHGFLEVWKRPAPVTAGGYYDVAIGASITGASRAELLRAIAGATRPVYCDTDSLICRDLDAPVHATKLGAWKIEETADHVYIAGKKLYACARDGEFVKWASKGVRISPERIRDIARGSAHTHLRESPSYTLKRLAHFINRTVRVTA
ncbi:MAG: DNA polymerase [Burkholderiales bacterium]